MAKDTSWRGKVAGFAALGLLAGLGGWGCQRDSLPGPEAEEEKNAKTDGTPTSDPASDPLHFLRQSFAEATRAEPYAEWEPVEKTMADKPIGPLYEKVKRSWDGVKLVTEEGKKLTYVATLDTEKGEIEITMQPDLAPNQVRSFVALIQAGYYDGLVFERAVTEQVPDGLVELIEGGAPDGGIKANTDGIGYWLKPEFNPTVTHEEGTVGATHGSLEEDTAACRFYIMMCKAPVLDGHWTVFGKVTKGMEVARSIFSQPIVEEIENPSAAHPLKPVVIRKVTVRSQEMEGASN